MRCLLLALPVLVGCTSNFQEASWLSVEKPPIRVIYISKADHIEPEVVHGVIASVKDVPYQNYGFNENVGVLLDVNSHKSLTKSNTQSYTVSK